jgi:hypothetical protein
LPRRAALLAAALAAATSFTPRPAASAEAAAETALVSPPSSATAASFLPDLPAAPLPQRYVDLTRRLVADLRTAITTETAGADEFEVRRAAEPAKEAVKEWVGAYGRAASASSSSTSSTVVAVDGTPSHVAIQAALKTLGSFYGSKGQRARLDGATADAVLAALAAAEDGLPPPPQAGKSLKERLFGGGGE